MKYIVKRVNNRLGKAERISRDTGCFEIPQPGAKKEEEDKFWKNCEPVVRSIEYHQMSECTSLRSY